MVQKTTRAFSSVQLLSSVRFSTVTQSYLTLCYPMNCSMPGLPVHHQLLKSTQTHAHWVDDAQFSSVHSLSSVQLFATPWITASQASLSITISWSSLKLMSIELVMTSSHLILCRPLFLLPPIPPIIRVFSNESILCMRWPKYWWCSIMSFSLTRHGPQHTRLPCPSPTPGAFSDSWPLSQWYDPTISSPVVLFSSYLQSFPELGSFSMSQFFASKGVQSTGASTSASVLPMNFQDWFLLGLTGLISL